MSLAGTQELLTPEMAGKPPQGRPRFSSVLTYGATFATEFLVLLSQIALYKLVANRLGQTGFSEYAVARRIVAVLQPLAMLGLGVGLPRYIALADGGGQSDRTLRYFCGTLLWVGGATAVLSAAFLIWPGQFSYLFFGSVEQRFLIAPLTLMLVGISAHFVFYAFLRGKLALGRANSLQLINCCFLPLGVFVIFHKDAANFLWYLGLACLASTGIMFLFTSMAKGWKNPRQESRELISYGLQRVPGDFALMALLALPAIFAAHIAGIRYAGFVAFGLAIVNMIASVFSPVGVILLPKVSHAMGREGLGSVQRELLLLRHLALVVALTIVVLTEVFGVRLTRLYLGHEYAGAQAVINVLVLGAVPLSFYYALRGAIDALHHRAVNTFNLVAALGLFLLGAGLGAELQNVQCLLWSFPLALTVLGLLTHREIRRILKSGSLQAANPDSLSSHNLACDGLHLDDEPGARRDADRLRAKCNAE